MGGVTTRADESGAEMTITLEHTSVLGWLLDAGISADRARRHVEMGHIYLDGARVGDPDAERAGGRVDLRVPAVPGRDES
jgi:hypothetical protein